jgi:hypothetical protein
MSKDRLQPEQQTIQHLTRRRVLTFTALALAGGAGKAILDALYNTLPSQYLMSPIATAVAVQRKETNFKSERGFTEEHFKELQRSTFAVFFKFPDSKRNTTGSAWIAHVTESHMYLGLAGHELPHSLTGNFAWDSMHLTRPHVDTSVIDVDARSGVYAFHASRDLGVIKFPLAEANKSFIALPWIDNYPFSSGQVVLNGGYPTIYRGDCSDRHNCISFNGNMYTQVTNINPKISHETLYKHYFNRYKLDSSRAVSINVPNSGGSSGSPSATLVDGKLTIVGTVTAVDDTIDIPFTDYVVPSLPPETVIYALDMQSLIAEVDKKV